MNELFLVIVALTLLYIAIMVMIIRWILRINRIVRLLEDIEWNTHDRRPDVVDDTKKKKGG